MTATNFPDGISFDGNILKVGTGTVTDATLVVATGITTLEGAVVTINEDIGAGAGDVFSATATVSGGDLTIAIWQDDGTAATEDTSVSWIAWGTE